MLFRRSGSDEQSSRFYIHMAHNAARAWRAATTAREKKLWRFYARCWLALAARKPGKPERVASH
jgi:hypothetical protein